MELLDTTLLDFCYNVLGAHCGIDLVEKVKFKMDNGDYSPDTIEAEKELINSVVDAYSNFNA